MAVDWQRMDCPHCGEGLQCVLCGKDVRRFDDAAVERGAEALDDLLLQLGVKPTYAPEHAPSETIKRTLARAVLRAAGGQDAV